MKIPSPELDSEAAYILGLIHDIGRRGGKMQARHALDFKDIILRDAIN